MEDTPDRSVDDTHEALAARWLSRWESRWER
jgi:hypothetical protein